MPERDQLTFFCHRDLVILFVTPTRTRGHFVRRRAKRHYLLYLAACPPSLSVGPINLIFFLSLSLSLSVCVCVCVCVKTCNLPSANLKIVCAYILTAVLPLLLSFQTPSGFERCASLPFSPPPPVGVKSCADSSHCPPPPPPPPTGPTPLFSLFNSPTNFCVSEKKNLE